MYQWKQQRKEAFWLSRMFSLDTPCSKASNRVIRKDNQAAVELVQMDMSGRRTKEVNKMSKNLSR